MLNTSLNKKLSLNRLFYFNRFYNMSTSASVSKSSNSNNVHDNWRIPNVIEPEPTLKVFNSLSNSKVSFLV